MFSGQYMPIMVMHMAKKVYFIEILKVILWLRNKGEKESWLYR